MLPIWSLVAIFSVLLSGYAALFEGAFFWLVWQLFELIFSAPDITFWQWFIILFIPNLLVGIARINNMFKD